MKAGAVIAAQRTKSPLYICRIMARGYRFERSWDKFAALSLYSNKGQHCNGGHP